VHAVCEAFLSHLLPLFWMHSEFDLLLCGGREQILMITMWIGRLVWTFSFVLPKSPFVFFC
jgi:hypothetical protein